MGKYAAVMIGPAGSGKSTLSAVLAEHYATKGRSTHICNFDPAAEELPYNPSIDIRDLISLEDAMEGKGLGPNGGLVFCMEYLLSQGEVWLRDQLGDHEDDFIIVDMPGQLEVLTHVAAVPGFVRLLEREGFHVVVLFLLDALAATADAGKFVSGCTFALSSMVCFDCPFVNVLSKCDLLPPAVKEGTLDHFCTCDFDYLDTKPLPERWRRMVRTLAGVIFDFNLVTFRPMDVTNAVYVDNLCQLVDEALQVVDDAEVNDRDLPDDANEAADDDDDGMDWRHY
ncbi:GPN-loop GTPase 3 [Trypanosoma rangeli]|uniref:GPN-loop GTPase 3 n=1 Tax=Trypanosoma rangeli TaxID=5698 RepID=A0A422P226_TRYRA|nr:GPN-loop GTPase 3 [Trypanosoma rangeli]RNF11767.1 GPN-loop GTPase 3 [Trypanosoma rangeli]|eukprot:RNF11767.1 GPN-loop GTPase 3 [Trypanosoma rangeli]